MSDANIRITAGPGIRWSETPLPETQSWRIPLDLSPSAVIAKLCDEDQAKLDRIESMLKELLGKST